MKISHPQELVVQYTDLEKPVGIYYFEGRKHFTLELKTDDLTLFFPLCHSIFKDQKGLAGTSSIEILDTYNILSCPDGISLSLQSGSQVGKGVFFSFGVDLIEQACKRHKLQYEDFKRIFSNPIVLSRNNWMNEIVHRYISERQLNNTNCATSCNFLETEIIKELYFLYTQKNNFTKDRFDLGDYNFKKFGPQVQKAILYMDDQLYKVLSIEQICKHIGSGVTTFRRVFKNEVGIPPMAYFRKRKQEEGYSLLRTGRYSVSDVAFMLGFEEVSSFVSAFKKTFGISPKHLIPS